jgi:hypothetical protein
MYIYICIQGYRGLMLQSMGHQEDALYDLQMAYNYDSRDPQSLFLIAGFIYLLNQ